jgi:hypothetical protein
MNQTTSSSLFGETTRDKLYNSLFLVGPHLERYMAVGFLKCLDFLMVRSWHAGTLHVETSVLHVMMPSFCSSHWIVHRQAGLFNLQGVILVLPLQAAAAVFAASRRSFRKPIQLFHVAMLAVWLSVCVVVINVRAGGIYFWLKDISPIFLKIHALYGALDILNKVLYSCC